jgi:hypothetical protein
MPETIEPPKQADYSKVSKGAVDSWMSGLKEAESASNPPADPPPPPAAPTPAEPATPPASAKDPEPAKPSAEEPESPDKWPRSAAEWKKFIKVRDDNYSKRDSRIKELESKLTETEKAMKGLPADPQTFETLKQERERYEQESKDLSERLRLAAIESHPKFKAYYDGKLNAQIELAKRIVGTDKADAITEALRLPEGAYKTSRIEELSVDLSQVQASRLGSVLNAIEEIEADKRNEVTRAKTDYEAAQAKATAEAAASRERTASEANALFESIVKQAGDPKDGIAMFQTRDGDEAWNKAVKARIDGARATLFGNGTGKSPDQLIRKALLAEAFPALLENYNSMLTELGNLKAQVDKLTRATPTLETRSTTTGQGSTREQPKVGSRPMSIAEDWMKGLQEASR